MSTPDSATKTLVTTSCRGKKAIINLVHAAMTNLDRISAHRTAYEIQNRVLVPEKMLQVFPIPAGAEPVLKPFAELILREAVYLSNRVLKSDKHSGFVEYEMLKFLDLAGF